MKKLLTILLLIFNCTFMKAQKETANFVELFLGFSNCPQPNTYTFYLDKIGTVWAANQNFNPPGFFINEDPDIDSSIYPWHIQNSIVEGDWKGWNIVYSQDQTTINGTVVPVYGYGLYKISTNASDSHFYIDYRDDRIPFYNVAHIGDAVDHWVKYNFSNHKFYISPISSTDSYTEISNGDLIRLWELKQTNPAIPSTLEFPDYWDNCLALIPDENDHPKLIWGPYPVNLGIYEYRIYRNYGGWELLATVDADEFTYVDETLSLTQPGEQAGTDVYYYVKGVYTENPPNPIETSESNTVIINVPGEDIDKKSVSNNYHDKLKYNLTQNFPNPFNPSTSISYSIPENFYVTLKVYDILGTVVADLVNERKEAGNYKIPFNASNLSSGIYFYTLKANGYSFTKKMILIK